MAKKPYRRPDVTQIELDATARMLINSGMSGWAPPEENEQTAAALQNKPIIAPEAKGGCEDTIVSRGDQRLTSG